MSERLAGRVVIVTGAGRGLGREHALLAAREGASVVVNDLEDGDGKGPAHDVVAEIVAFGGRAVADGHSVTGWDSAKEIIQTALTSFGRLDGVVSNAGFLRDRMLTNMSEAEWDDVVKVHQYGTFYILRHAAEYWRAQHKAGEHVDASVVTTTAISGLHSHIGQVNYGAAKAAIALMTLASARELGRYGVRVNAISPLAQTRLTMGISASGDHEASDAGPDLSPGHVSPLVVWLLGNGSTATAQVYGVFGREIHRYHTGWQAAEGAHSDYDWTVESVGAAVQGWPDQFDPGRVPGLPTEVATS
ncbi:SDR family oxidoreductase [Rhodococcus sp. T2V]|uniref:SDR family NAD(P)-dependent oxidoreductase n=1 Tax=Rhodococcus sp. T2V TaxID=3034164 RepID=UPI0023E24A19|nr:SDR family NAD(P)-dependent oxidoreductase [Rhodococcus sp. T2V]MDF3311148.1 SDR family oxidoreductase [Rhodococcus sp. T2V]